jgi:AraC-like DNA-binding protein
MSRSLAIPVHHLEYLFRYYNKNTFVEFRNILRVRYTLLCLEQDLWKTYTLEAIGEKAGFTSRTTLFRVFKQVTGKSPKAYLDAMQQSHTDLTN